MAIENMYVFTGDEVIATDLPAKLNENFAKTENGMTNLENRVIPIEKGGTGATSVAGARNNLGLGNTSGALPIANGGTGATSVAGARNNLGLGNTNGALPIANGGTGATTASDACKNLGAVRSVNNVNANNDGNVNLQTIYCPRVRIDLNDIKYKIETLNISEVDGSTTNVPISSHHYFFNHYQSVDSRYGLQLLYGMTTTGIFFRQKNNGTYSDWRALPHGKFGGDLTWGNDTVRYVKTSYQSGTSWARVWSDGWVEQGGVTPTGRSGTTVTLKYPFADTNYCVLAQDYSENYANPQSSVSNLTTTSFLIRQHYGNDLSQNHFWYACGRGV